MLTSPIFGTSCSQDQCIDPNAFQWVEKSQKLYLPMENVDPYPIHGSFIPFGITAPKKHLDWFSHISRADSIFRSFTIYH